VTTIDSRFGEIEFDPDKVLYFPEGLIGFEDMRRFVVMPNRKDSPLFWIQSVDDAEIAFLLTDPTHFFLDYRAIPDARECEKLGISPKDECYCLSVVTVHRDKSITLNLAAPLFFSPTSNRAIQVILEGAQFKTRTPLPNPPARG
jgi:flagellar assembly factor FliW